ncbi:hypothetical protein M231_01348 [Tremella mesenterica]|uniref:Uncharacterized protein n=1 Tax=Tremella mesenterica TaxID=5217 RepID=A0A4Q1BU07_TREME|nr:uncharacterized protein TREMEDRAFT_74034 [Tremella mesenterica DSM 1558]EIW69114.1 hypothetical protein TREMEDRAFT_74034 [Tremella mesenterica DSM 1558]RXK41442.1 hypothetical protein M231_01348 [Tremella mesenterica]
MSNPTVPLQNSDPNAQTGMADPQQKFMGIPKGAGLLAKKGFLAKGGSSIVSPTDNVLSPCSAKLSGAKQRHFQPKQKPMGISSQLSQLAASNSSQSNVDESKPKTDL